jgi:hypothetical protein
MSMHKLAILWEKQGKSMSIMNASQGHLFSIIPITMKMVPMLSSNLASMCAHKERRKASSA